jgi:hypothetical protein
MAVSNPEHETRSYKLGVAALVIGYFTLIFYIAAIFTSIKLQESFDSPDVYSVIVIIILIMLVLAAGIVLLVSFVKGLKEKRETKKFTRGLIFTIAGFPPVFLVYLALLVKVLTENH